ncbi:PcfJ domain-containing protein [Bacteroides ovatus]|uniref:PcfJ domain-containing protein n=1 Tax=Bacteroides ovatus TaxID=28116 RepID=UPI0021651EF7|nr:PcfJ domain-containing protein [Bacteroides ovatus]MCS2930608.1 PcfJ domain-containing protein [Bacteroides ovatus]
MKARTKFQHQVVAANGRLLPITERQKEWAFRHTVKHFAFRTPSGWTTCLDCGHRWNETKTKHCTCPNCNARLTLKNTLCRKTEEKSYFSVITTQDGLQVQRIFRINAYYNKGENARTDLYEVARYWLDENGKTALTALQRTMGRYLDCFLYGSGLELRNDNYTYQYISDCYIYPKYTVIPKLRRNGLKGSFTDIAPQKLMKALLSDSRVETILKSGRKRDLKHFIDHPQDLDFCWPSYKIVLRRNYRITDMGIWVDYLRMLDRCGKDLHNAHYVCPADLCAEHDKYQEKVRILRKQEERKEQIKIAMRNEARFRELKGKFFGLEFTDGTIIIRVLDSVIAYYEEGNALHHCVGECEYYLKPDTLVFSARVEDKRVETVELSLQTFKVLQSRGLCNRNTEYHDRIIKLVQKNVGLIRKRMAA